MKTYMEKAMKAPVMPLHLGTWWSIGSPVKPAANGRIEFALFQDLRKSRRLLPLQATAEVDAGYFKGLFGSPGSAETRFSLIRARLGQVMFTDGFEP